MRADFAEELEAAEAGHHARVRVRQDFAPLLRGHRQRGRTVTAVAAYPIRTDRRNCCKQQHGVEYLNRAHKELAVGMPCPRINVDVADREADLYVADHLIVRARTHTHAQTG